MVKHLAYIALFLGLNVVTYYTKMFMTKGWHVLISILTKLYFWHYSSNKFYKFLPYHYYCFPIMKSKVDEGFDKLTCKFSFAEKTNIEDL